MVLKMRREESENVDVFAFFSKMMKCESGGMKGYEYDV